MIGVILAILVLPLAAGIACFWMPARAAAGLTVASGIASFGLVLALIPHAAHGTLAYLSYLRVDAVSGVFLLATGFLYAAVAVYAAGYLKGRTDRYARRFYLGFNVFAWAMLAAPVRAAWPCCGSRSRSRRSSRRCSSRSRLGRPRMATAPPKRAGSTS